MHAFLTSILQQHTVLAKGLSDATSDNSKLTGDNQKLVKDLAKAKADLTKAKAATTKEKKEKVHGWAQVRHRPENKCHTHTHTCIHALLKTPFPTCWAAHHTPSWT